MHIAGKVVLFRKTQYNPIFHVITDTPCSMFTKHYRDFWLRVYCFVFLHGFIKSVS